MGDSRRIVVIDDGVITQVCVRGPCWDSKEPQSNYYAYASASKLAKNNKALQSSWCPR